MNTEKPNSKEQNEYAKNVKGEPIFILNAESGRNGYWCMGCDAEMEAVRRKKNILHKSYFRHVPKDVKKGEIPCTFSNQGFRHNLAIDILQRTKRIKVPNLYKYAPDGKNAKLIQEAKFIEAHSVKAELRFYENDNGNVLFGKNPENDNKNLLIRPDVTFFDVQGKPILLIEIVVTHKLNDDKKAKIRRLGIDTIQIIIPKDSPENIAKNFLVTKNTKWVFNHVEQNTNYFQLPSGNTEGISQIDELQMGLLRESIICRRNQISNLIRSITRCLESQSYKRTERLFEQEIQRIEKAAREHQSRLDEIQEGIENEIYSEIGKRREEIDNGKEELAKDEKLWNERYSELERRYYKRRREIREEKENISRKIELKFGIEKTENEIRREFEYKEKLVESEQETISERQGRILRDIESESRFKDNFESRRESLKREFSELEIKEQESFKRLKDDFESKAPNYKELEAEIDTTIRSDIERRYKQIAKRVDKRDVQGRDELSERIKSILELRGLFDSYTNGQATIEKYRKGIQLIKNGTWKEWD